MDHLVWLFGCGNNDSSLRREGKKDADCSASELITCLFDRYSSSAKLAQCLFCLKRVWIYPIHWKQLVVV